MTEVVVEAITAGPPELGPTPASNLEVRTSRWGRFWESAKLFAQPTSSGWPPRS